MCGLNDVELPTIDRIEQKKKDIDAALNYEYKEEDIDRIIEEKNRFRSHPTNYAMKKTQLMKVCQKKTEIVLMTKIFINFSLL